MNRIEFFRKLSQTNISLRELKFQDGSIFVYPDLMNTVCVIPDISIDENRCPRDLFLDLVCHLYMECSTVPLNVQFKDIHRFVTMKKYLSLNIDVKIVNFPWIKIWEYDHYSSEQLKDLINTLMGVPLIRTCDFHLDRRDKHITYYDWFNDDIAPKHSRILLNERDILKTVYRDSFSPVIEGLLRKSLNL